ncbi:DUF5053 domain-containing protein [Phocaeicola fibrisolvens]|uniref:DUF5053 domain-containing protein n=1 Tax=Phocaeicola fibrisolvens TaxID=2981793 RepID=UPI000821804B|nr:DUF5053 domain-containing protein [Phocaeicola fibrisolvens]MCU6778343.1 DUF5053 domain-containing protein [Phocaeicola fibrisolvens]SCH84372.1 Uncharacterised protein [uncultured Bacteroides sp.]
MDNMDKYLPNADMQAAFEKFKELKTSEEKLAFKKEMQEKLSSMNEADRKKYIADSKEGLKATVEACEDFITRAEETILKDKLGELPDIISFSYIAKKYFGKSRNWLYQRINGYTVNGKPAKFTQNEFQTFLNALEDISNKIKRTSASLKFN